MMKPYTSLRRLFCLGTLLFLLAGCAPAQSAMGQAADGAGRVTGDGSAHAQTLEDITICVDAGHGFDDVGTESSYLGDVTEKDINLTIALALRDALEKKGFTVILTHDGESFPKTALDDGNRLFNPQERIAYTNTLELDYFVSIHCDSYEADASVHGTRIYYSNGTDYTKESAAAAKQICTAVNRAFPDARETVTRDMSHDSAYYVIRECDAPSSLVEVGFVTNRTDVANMLDPDWCISMAEAIAEGIYQYFAE